MPAGPYKLVTVNTAPERAQRLVGRLIEALKIHTPSFMQPTAKVSIVTISDISMF